MFKPDQVGAGVIVKDDRDLATAGGGVAGNDTDVFAISGQRLRPHEVHDVDHEAGERINDVLAVTDGNGLQLSAIVFGLGQEIREFQIFLAVDPEQELGQAVACFGLILFKRGCASRMVKLSGGRHQALATV